MGKKLSDDDVSIWAKEAASVDALMPGKKPFRAAGAGGESSKASTQQSSVASAPPSTAIAGQTKKAMCATPLSVGGYQGVDAATARKMKRGQLPVDACLDLHGLTQAEALEALEACVADAVKRRLRLLLIITGKGGRGAALGQGVLRARLPEWLNLPQFRSYLLAIDRAAMRHGGSGAFYVLLKQKRV